MDREALVGLRCPGIDRDALMVGRTVVQDAPGRGSRDEERD